MIYYVYEEKLYTRKNLRIQHQLSHCMVRQISKKGAYSTNLRQTISAC